MEGSGNWTDIAVVLNGARIRALEAITSGKTLAATSGSALSFRALPSLAYVIDRLPNNSMVYDIGAGRGRHTLYALKAGHRVVAVERRTETLSDLRQHVQSLGSASNRAVIVEGDYLVVRLEQYDPADLVIATGLLQLSRSFDELQQSLQHLGQFAAESNAIIFIEMRHVGEITLGGKRDRP
jgi:SAM-dependent methyltransferase